MRLSKCWHLALLLPSLMAALMTTWTSSAIAADAVSSSTVSNSAVPKNVLLIGWDAAQRDHVRECLGRKELPNLQKLADEGTMVEIDIEGTTDTKAGWSQILTGYYPEITGVYSNGRYQSIPEGYSVPERLEKHFGDDGIATLAVIGKSGHVDALPPQKIPYDPAAEAAKAAKQAARAQKQAARTGQPAKKRPKPEGTIIEENGVQYRFIPGKPHFHMSQNVDFFQNGLMLDEKVGSLAIEQIEKHKDSRIFAFIHFATVDHSGHQHGENSQEYTDALISNDAWLGKIVAKLKELGQYDKTLIYVVADHGFDEGKSGHSNAPLTLLTTNDKRVIRGGLRQDIAPTVLEAFGVDLGKLDPPLDGVSLTKPCPRENVVLGAASPHAGRAVKPAAQPKRTQPKRTPGPRAGKRAASTATAPS